MGAADVGRGVSSGPNGECSGQGPRTSGGRAGVRPLSALSEGAHGPRASSHALLRSRPLISRSVCRVLQGQASSMAALVRMAALM